MEDRIREWNEFTGATFMAVKAERSPIMTGEFYTLQIKFMKEEVPHMVTITDVKGEDLVVE